MANEQHLEWLKEGVEAWNARRKKDDFIPDLSGANLSGSNLISTTLPRANLSCAILSGAVLSGSVLSEADFSDADLYGADLSFADLSRADLTRADIRSADISGADFRGANLTHANVQTEYSTADTNISHTPYTYRNTMFLDQVQLDSMIGDSCSIIPNHLTRPAHWPEFVVPDEEDSETDDTTEIESARIQAALNTPIVRSSKMDFNITADGIAAVVPDDITIPQRLGSQNCRDRRDALITLAENTAKGIDNKLGENTKNDLSQYAAHLREYDPINPYTLEDLIAQIAADTSDPMVAEGYSDRVKTQLTRLSKGHREFVSNCAPNAQTMIDVQNTATLSRLPTREEMTMVLDKFINAIETAQIAAQSTQDLLVDLKAMNTKINQEQSIAFSDAQKSKIDNSTEKEVKNVATLTTRLYLRCLEYRVKPWAAVQDTSVLVTLSGKSIPDLASQLAKMLEPIVETFRQLLTALPLV